MKTRFILLNLIVIFVFFSCKNEQVSIEQEDSMLVEITRDQFKSEGMRIGIPEHILIEENIHFTGQIVSSLDGIRKISAPLEGFVKSIRVQKGQDVKANTTILEIGGNALIDLQQAYATSSAKIKHLKSNYERAKKLYVDKINTESEFMLSESNYKSELANYNALRLKLKNIGLNLSNIEKGIYSSTYRIKAPFSGQLTRISCVSGQYISQEDDIAEVLKKGKVELELSFFEKYFSKISVGQKVVFKGMDASSTNATAIINRIGIQLGSSSNTFECYATINEEDLDFYAVNQSVSGDVSLEADSVFAIPQTAIMSSENKKFVLVQVNEDGEKYYFKRTIINTGRFNKEYVELIDFPKDKKILIEGTYNLSVE